MAYEGLLRMRQSCTGTLMHMQASHSGMAAWPPMLCILTSIREVTLPQFRIGHVEDKHQDAQQHPAVQPHIETGSGPCLAVQQASHQGPGSQPWPSQVYLCHFSRLHPFQHARVGVCQLVPLPAEGSVGRVQALRPCSWVVTACSPGDSSR